MSDARLEHEGPGGPPHIPLSKGLTRIGAAGAEVELEGIASGELHVWSDPPKVLYVALDPGATRPLLDGQPFGEQALRPGARITWGAHVLSYTGPAAVLDQAELEELDPGSAEPFGGLWERIGRRVAAGALCEAGMADRKVMARWQKAIEGGEFRPDPCALELLPDPLPPGLHERLLDRGGTLLRDFLMASRLHGVRGAARRVRERGRSALAFVVVQLGVLLVFAVILAAIMLVLRLHRGVSFDAWIDRLLP
jgi:hypothetical protein